MKNFKERVNSKKPIFQTFLTNCRILWKEHSLIIILYCISLMCDALSTIHFMLKERSAVEIHLAVRFVLMLFGPVLGPLLGAVAKAIAGIIVAVYCRRFAVHILVAASIISFCAACYNIWA